MTDDAPWLDDAEQCLWRTWLTMQRDVSAALQRQMQADGGLSMPDFEVLVNLTEAPEGRIRISELARNLLWERSRLSHQVRRMEARGLVSRAGCPDDGRGAFCEVTAAGRQAIEQVAPDHVRAVRRLFFDRLSADDQRDLRRILDTWVAASPENERPAVAG